MKYLKNLIRWAYIRWVWDGDAPWSPEIQLNRFRMEAYEEANRWEGEAAWRIDTPSGKFLHHLIALLVTRGAEDRAIPDVADDLLSFRTAKVVVRDPTGEKADYEVTVRRVDGKTTAEKLAELRGIIEDLQKKGERL